MQAGLTNLLLTIKETHTGLDHPYFAVELAAALAVILAVMAWVWLPL